jgi:hypothetical protein
MRVSWGRSIPHHHDILGSWGKGSCEMRVSWGHGLRADADCADADCALGARAHRDSAVS